MRFTHAGMRITNEIRASHECSQVTRCPHIPPRSESAFCACGGRWPHAALKPHGKLIVGPCFATEWKCAIGQIGQVRGPAGHSERRSAGHSCDLYAFGTSWTGRTRRQLLSTLTPKAPRCSQMRPASPLRRRSLRPLAVAAAALYVQCTAVSATGAARSTLCSTVTCLSEGSTTCDRTTATCPPCVYTITGGYSCYSRVNGSCPFTNVLVDCTSKCVC